MFPDNVETKPYKAIAGAVTALVTIVVAAVLDGHIDGGEVALIIGGVAAVGAAVYAIKNPVKDPPVV